MLLQKELAVVEDSYYEATVQRSSPTAPLAGQEQADVCVVGGGYAGVSAALELAGRGYSVILLEAQRIGWGASGRNGGQVIVGFGADGECAIEKQFSAEDARRAWDVSVEGMQLLQQRMADHAIACEWQPGYLSLSVKAARSRALQRWMDHVSGTYGYPLRWIAPADIGGWIASDRYHAGVYDARSGHLHPLRYCLGLARAAQQAGVRVYESSAVLALRHGPRALLQTALGSVSCQHAILAGNVYLAEYGADVAPQVSGRIMPVGTYMIATEPMAPERAVALMPERTAASDTNHLLDYFRVSADHRVLFGGGDSFSKTLPRNLIERIRRNMLRVFPQLGDVHVAHAWGGFVDVTMNLAPDFGRLAPNVYYVQGFSGHGVAMAGMAGKLVAEAVAAQAERFDLFARIRHRRFPGGTLLRTPALALGMWYYRLRDAL